MKKRDLFYVVNEIDDKLIEEAMEEINIKNKAKIKKVWASVLSAAAVFALVISLSAYGGNVTLKPSIITTEATTITTKQQKPDDKATTAHKEPKSTEAATKPAETEPQKTTVTKTEDTSNTTVKDTPAPLTEKATTSVTTEKMPSQSYASYSFEYWKNAPDVVWGTDAVKGADSETVPMGAVKITEQLKKLMNSGDEETVYAVQVGFSSCAEAEFENWEYNGTTFAQMKKGYNKAEMTAEEIALYKTTVWEMKYAFCNKKIASFKDTFKKSGISIYTIERNVTDCFFYVFGTKKQIESISPKATEAFVLYPADHLK